MRADWSGGVWNNIFKADNSKTFDMRDNCLLDDFCEYCGYTIEQQLDSSNLIISGPVNLLGVQVRIRLSIEHNAGVFSATYKVIALPFINLVVKFREANGQLIVEDDLQDANIVTRALYKPIADRFVSDGAQAIECFMTDL